MCQDAVIYAYFLQGCIISTADMQARVCNSTTLINLERVYPAVVEFVEKRPQQQIWYVEICQLQSNPIATQPTVNCRYMVNHETINRHNNATMYLLMRANRLLCKTADCYRRLCAWTAHVKLPLRLSYVGHTTVDPFAWTLRQGDIPRTLMNYNEVLHTAGRWR
jgi:hypothetical protein